MFLFYHSLKQRPGKYFEVGGAEAWMQIQGAQRQGKQGKVRELDLWSGKKFEANFYALFVVNSSQAKKKAS